MLQNNMYHVWAFEAHTAELFETGVWGFEDLLFCPKACYVLWHKETAFIQGVSDDGDSEWSVSVVYHARDLYQIG